MYINLSAIVQKHLFKVILEEAEMEIVIENCSVEDWFKLNPDFTGYYRYLNTVQWCDCHSNGGVSYHWGMKNGKEDHSNFNFKRVFKHPPSKRY